VDGKKMLESRKTPKSLIVIFKVYIQKSIMFIFLAKEITLALLVFGIMVLAMNNNNSNDDDDDDDDDDDIDAAADDDVDSKIKGSATV
jgi:hypothetical protein